MNPFPQDVKTKEFFAYFLKAVEHIRKINGESYGITFQKILLVSLIDAMSKSVYPRRGNKERFTKTIQEFGGWNESNRVSVPHLWKLLQICPDPDFEELRKVCFPKHKSWRSGALYMITDDLEYSLVRSKWPKEKELLKPLEGVGIDDLMHINLFYRYRNSLIHEFRRLDLGIGRKDELLPFYISLTQDPRSMEKFDWVLVYPVQFFVDLTQNITKNLETYFLSNGLNPKESYIKGIYWLEKLNVQL